MNHKKKIINKDYIIPFVKDYIIPFVWILYGIGVTASVYGDLATGNEFVISGMILCLISLFLL